ncbi:hypothetical protein [Spirosoma rhododendri]|uniref:Uncharacterized protein n=1 Tax=Spirosoma rhododendri TaxID=2728024 RepID=A0A7L5DQE4_9BACT|nr:hypothetical protein [Spirosoma rhododendri]QJD77930.1 hypothetical protein HH216_05445 [Spirosoma rhododendri]
MRYGLLVITLFFVRLLASAQATKTVDQYDERWQAELDHLTQQLGWRTPTLKEGEYEVYVWNRQGLVRGAAHSVYRIRKTNQRLTVDGYRIRYTPTGTPSVQRDYLKARVSMDDWNKLVDKHLLTLPTWSDVQARYYASFPKDSTWNELSSDGTVTVKARRTRGRMAVSDGEAYAFSIFSHDGFRFYSYSNPSTFYREYTDIPELRDVTEILTELNQLF